MDQSGNANESSPAPPSTTDKESEPTQTQRIRAAKQEKGEKGFKSIEHATSRPVINDEQVIHGPTRFYRSRNEVSPREWQSIQERYNARTKAERRLFEATSLLPHKCRIDIDPDRMRSYVRLFGQKSRIPEDPSERARDDVARRRAIAEIMQAREVAGFERVGEADKWNDLGLDITKALQAKLESKYFVELQERCADRRAHNQFRETQVQIIEHTPGGSIPKYRKHWLRAKTNLLMCSPDDKAATAELQRTSIQVIYWIIRRRKEAGIPLVLTHSSASAETIATHRWLLNQPLSFFENDDFKLDSYFDIEIEEIKNLTVREKELGGPNSDIPVLHAETIAKLDEELESFLSDDKPATAPPAPATAFSQISAHTHGVPSSGPSMTAGATNFGGQAIYPGPGNARKRERSSSPEYMDTSDDSDGDYMQPEPISPVRPSKKRRETSP